MSRQKIQQNISKWTVWRILKNENCFKFYVHKIIYSNFARNDNNFSFNVNYLHPQNTHNLFTKQHNLIGLRYFLSGKAALDIDGYLIGICMFKDMESFQKKSSHIRDGWHYPSLPVGKLAQKNIQFIYFAVYKCILLLFCTLFCIFFARS